MKNEGLIQEFIVTKDDFTFEDDNDHIFKDNVKLEIDDSLCTGYFLKGTDILNGKGKKIWPDGS
jgi:hypothetical protein